jgi:hypothetical protein
MSALCAQKGLPECEYDPVVKSDLYLRSVFDHNQRSVKATHYKS